MSKTPPDAPQDDLRDAALRERLVAYLDRELPHRESEQIEQEIAHNEAARSTLEGLDRAWRALDALPVEKTEADFTRTTLALAAQASLGGSVGGSASQKSRTPRLPSLRSVRWLTPAACALVAFALAWLTLWMPERRTLDTLPVALASDALKQIDDLDFLRRLAARTPELERAANDPAIAEQAQQWLSVEQMTLAQRRDWVQSLDNKQREEAARLSASLRAAGAAAQPIRERHQAMMAADDAQELAKYASAYGAYVASLSTGQQAELRTADSDWRVRRVAKDLRRWRIERLLEVTTAERVLIADHLDAVAESELIERITGQLERARTGRSGPNRPGPNRYAEMVRRRVQAAPAEVFSRMGAAYRRSNDDRPPRSPRDALSRFFSREFSRSWPEIEQAIVEGMPERIAGVFEAEQLDADNRTEAVVKILQQVAGGDSPGDLGEVFESLNSSKQIRYLGMPAEEMLEQLDDDWAAQTGFAEPGFDDREPPFRSPLGPPGARPPERPPRDRGVRPPRPR